MSHHHHNHECSCCCHDEHHHHDCCGQESSCCHEKHGSSCDFGHKLIEMADEAWMELLKEKIKANIASTSGGHLDQLARIVTETNHTRWQNKMAKQKNIHQFKEKLEELFNCSSCSK